MVSRRPAAKRSEPSAATEVAAEKSAPAAKPASKPVARRATAARSRLDSFDYWLKASLEKLAHGDLRETQLPPRELSDDELAIAERLIAIREYQADYADRIDDLARGEYDGRWPLHSRYDSIGSSVQRMMRLMDDMTRVCKTVMTGDTDAKMLVKGLDDKLAIAFNSVVDTLRDAADQAEVIARGDFRVEVRPKGAKDRLGNALYEMTRMLRDVTGLTNVLASGDLSQRLSLRGDNDLLGVSLQSLSDTLRDSCDQLDIIADGDYRAEIQPRGPRDRLGHTQFRMVRQLREASVLMEQVAIGNLSNKLEVKSERDLLGTSINRVVDTLRETAERANQIADGDFSADIAARNADDTLGIALRKMDNRLRELTKDADSREWLGQWQNTLAEQMLGELDYQTLGSRVLDVIVNSLDAQVAVFYILNDPRTLQLAASYAFTHRRNGGNEYATDQGLLGQACNERKVMVIDAVPPDYMPVGSALGESAPRQLMLVPLEYRGELFGIIELASLKPFAQQHLQLVENIRESIALTISMAKSRDKMSELLAESQAQSEELQTQQEELRAFNEELEEQTKMLKDSEERLKQQSEELQATNEELEEKTEYLERQRQDIAQQNTVLEVTRSEIEEKARQLEVTSRYKSEFLANMSHELRTPLNSMLLLSRSLEDNDDGNLTEEQMESMRVIHSGGRDLLNLINEILDLSKVESGKMSVACENVSLEELLSRMSEQFAPQAKERGLTFELERAAEAPEWLTSDSQRIEQILKNLLSNAFKFTDQGRIGIRISQAAPQTRFSLAALRGGNCLALAVSDTGVGVPPEKQEIIFEAFQQADGSTSRRYGGTGLGLTISRELAKLLGGEIQLHSQAGQGSTFTLYLPLTPAEGDYDPHPANRPSAVDSARLVPPIDTAQATAMFSTTPLATLPPGSDDRENIQPGERCILVIEDDIQFGKLVLGLAAKKGFKRLQALSGNEGLDLACQFRPSAIILDLGLPDISGETVLERLKHNLDTRHIPVHVVSGRDKDPELMLKGALSYLAKPASKDDLLHIFDQAEEMLANPVRELLLIEDDTGSQTSVERLLQNKALTITKCETAEDGFTAMATKRFDLIILDLTLPGMSGLDFLKQLYAEMGDTAPPVVVYTGKDLTPVEYQDLRAFTDTVVIKGASSPERLLDEVTLFLHTVESSFSPTQRKMIRMLHDDSITLKGKKVLLVDDDIRNTFALSKVLRNQGLEVTMADDGKLALEKLASDHDFDVVLMDIMMPVMDGYEAMRQIRAQRKFAKLPIIALTAQAMVNDRQKCIEAGASDYLPKPVDIDKLLSMMRVWLFERRHVRREG